MKEEFVKFLKEEGILETYVINSLSDYDDIITGPYSYICCAFSWTYSPEGYEFWECIYMQWNEIVMANI